ncbi:cytochrome c [Ancylobacter sp. A5.8]|uniref:c-type cytochrome n=1 Tax=Ancylobacter gelatini TaxID=2919920 RepID=UPI001F4F0B3E|nr:cytochrome c [Ancylobacter gelatini]MCJ8143773.1 cytochrome c [Ancylobacter gelatini]
MTRLYAVPLAAVSIMLCAPVQAQDARAGRTMASAQCAVCHGTNGMSQHPEAPNLAGQVEMYLAKALEEFRSGKRSNEMMTVVVKDLSDSDIANLAAWYASIEITVQTPP